MVTFPFISLYIVLIFFREIPLLWPHTLKQKSSMAIVWMTNKLMIMSPLQNHSLSVLALQTFEIRDPQATSCLLCDSSAKTRKLLFMVKKAEMNPRFSVLNMHQTICIDSGVQKVGIKKIWPQKPEASVTRRQFCRLQLYSWEEKLPARNPVQGNRNVRQKLPKT